MNRTGYFQNTRSNQTFFFRKTLLNVEKLVYKLNLDFPLYKQVNLRVDKKRDGVTSQYLLTTRISMISAQNMFKLNNIKLKHKHILQ